MPTFDCTRLNGLSALNPEALVELVVKQAASRFVGLKPLAVNYELRDGPLAYVANNFSRGCRIGIDIDFGVFDPMGLKKLFSRAAISAPCRSVDLHLHVSILLCPAGTIFW